MLRFHYENENDNEISLSFSLRFCTQRDERLIASISSSTTTITCMNPGRTKEIMTPAHKFFSRTRCRSETLTSLLEQCAATVSSSSLTKASASSSGELWGSAKGWGGFISIQA